MRHVLLHGGGLAWLWAHGLGATPQQRACAAMGSYTRCCPTAEVSHGRQRRGDGGLMRRGSGVTRQWRVAGVRGVVVCYHAC